MKRHILVQIFIFCTLVLLGQDASKDLFIEANKHFETKNYDQAILQYQSILDEDVLSPELFSNLGSAHFQNGNLAKGILYYEKGLKHFPNNILLNQNIDLLRNQVSTEIFEVPDFVLIRFWKGFSRVFSTGIWASLQIIFLMLVLFGFYLWMLRSEQKIRRKGFVLFTISALALVIAIFAGMSKYQKVNSNSMAIVSDNIMLLSGPDERSGELTKLSEGVKIEIIDEIGEWYKVQLLNQQEGYMPKSKVLII